MSRPTRWLVFGLLAGFLLADRASAQTTYIWNSTGTDWATAANWTPSTNFPDTADTAIFGPNAAAIGTSIQNPDITSTRGAFSLTLAPNQIMGGWNFSGSGSLGLGGTGSTSLTTYGPAAYTFDGPALRGNVAGALNFTISNGSSLILAGNSKATTNLGTIKINGGTLRLDNSSTMISRLANVGGTNLITVNSGGLFELVGGSSAFTQAVGNLASTNSTSLNNQSGVNLIKVTPNGNSAILNFANSTAFSARPGIGAAYHFVAASGNLGDTDGAKITFVAAPFKGAGGLLANSNSSAAQTVGFAIVTDGLGTNWATYTVATGIVSIANSSSGATITTVADAPGLASLTSGSNGQFNPAAGTTVTASGGVTAASFRITPAGSGSSLAMGGNALTTDALMLDGANDFAITGTGNFGTGGPRYIHVNNVATTLSVGMVVANGTFPTIFAGPGFVDLTGGGSQNTLSGATRFVVAGGTVRANNTQVGFGSSGLGVIALTGGVLEINGGSNGAGAAADFTRALGNAAGNVTFGVGSGGDAGSGGFSAFGSNASVNLGGQASPTPLQWAQANFVADGFALKFGSSQSNAVLTFLNPIRLDTGTNPYQIREIQVISGAGGDRAVLAGIISGAANADLLKTGSGTLELTAANTFSGNTLVAQGMLLASNPSGSATGTGVVKVYNGAILRGTGAIAGNSDAGAVAIAPGGTLAPGGLVNTGVLTVNNSVSFAGSASVFAIRANGNSVGNGSSMTGYDQLAMTAGVIDLNNATLNLTVGYTPNPNSDALLIINNADDAVGLSGTFNGLPDGSVFSSGGVNWQIFYGTSADAHGGSAANDVVLVAVPVPEPASLLALGLSAVGICAMIRARRSAARRANSG